MRFKRAAAAAFLALSICQAWAAGGARPVEVKVLPAVRPAAMACARLPPSLPLGGAAGPAAGLAAGPAAASGLAPLAASLGTPGIFKGQFHLGVVNPRIQEDIAAGRYLRLTVKDGALGLSQAGPAVAQALKMRVELRAASLPPLEGVEGAELVLVDGAPGSPEAAHPLLLAVTRDDYQLGHAGTRRGASGKPSGRYGYMTAGFFTDEAVPAELAGAVAQGQLAGAGRRWEALAAGRAPQAEAFGEGELSALERLRPRLLQEFEGGRTPTAVRGRPLPEGLAARAIFTARQALSAAWAWLSAERSGGRVPWLFKLEKGRYYYHGETLEDLTRIVESGGVMAPEKSQFSLLPRDSVMYARTRQHNLGRAGGSNPIVMFQFPSDALTGLVSGESFRAAAMAIDLGVPPNHQSYAVAEKPVPLYLMTEASKRSLLDWVRLQAVRYPEDPRWSAFLPKLQAALRSPSLP